MSNFVSNQYKKVLDRLEDTRKAMRGLTGCSEDDIGVFMIDTEFDRLKTKVNSYMRCHFGFSQQEIEQ